VAATDGGRLPASRLVSLTSARAGSPMASSAGVHEQTACQTEMPRSRPAARPPAQRMRSTWRHAKELRRRCRALVGSTSGTVALGLHSERYLNLPIGRSRGWRFGLAGLALAAGAPLGLLALRFVSGRARVAALGAEWERDALTYWYVTCSTAVVFAAFGAMLGRSADRLSRLASRDGLTGLLNRTGMKERIAAEMRRQARRPSPLSLLVLDVDRMKFINDQQGHGAGDAALRHVAAAIAKNVRAVDAVSRWGGDEFLVLAPQTALQDAAVLASRICAAAAEPAAGAPPVSVSIGIASVPPADPDPSLDDLLRAADDALYEAKRAGGNQVGGAPPRP
ncbi:MAG: GGDEF domain-containing protein, partial [Vicinamibacteria bacterium]